MNKRPTIKVNGFYGVLPMGIIVNKEISSGAKVFFTFLFAVSYANGGISWYSQRKAAKILGVKDRTIRNWCAELKAEKLIDQKMHGPMFVTSIKKEALDGAIFVIDEGAENNFQGMRKEISANPGKFLPTNDSKEGDQMNENGVGLPSEVPHRPDPSSILDARSKATKLSREARDKNFKKKQDRLQAVSTSDRITGIERWKGTRFYEYLKHLCSKFEITIGDMTELSKNPPEKYARTMNDIIELCNRRQLSKQDFARMLEGLTSEWKCGASGSFSGDGKLYTNALREKIDRLVSMYGPKKQSVPEVEIETIPLDELYLKKPETEVKKEDNA